MAQVGVGNPEDVVEAQPIYSPYVERTVGDTVNVDDASYLNNIWDAKLRAVWSDPDFDPGLRAFYYVRVLEIPTPTWPAYDKKFYAADIPDSVGMKGQERAYTSPIWYTT